MKTKSIVSTPIEMEVNLPGYPIYPANDDIYEKSKLEQKVNADKELEIGNNNGDDLLFGELKNNMMGDDLDIPGSELDNASENIGSEDEENNYYSESDSL